MKKISTFILAALFASSCSTTKKIASDNQLENTSWELEFLSGPRIAFETLYPNNKPNITFNQTNNKIEGNNSCNTFASDYSLDGNNISIKEAGVSTLKFCGQGEVFFKNTMQKVNKYSIDSEGKLNLMINNVPMMRFKKTTP